MAIVLDASAAVQIVLGSADGMALQPLIAQESEVFAPDFLQIECANAFWKYVHAGALDAAEAKRLHRNAVNIATRYVRQNDLLDEALATAVRLDHPVYDALYLVLARRLDATLVSLDRQLLKLCAQEHVDCIEPVTID